jgi:GMP synthase-like glutamine amidotransferase
MKTLSKAERAPDQADATIEHILHTALPDAVAARLCRKKQQLADIGAIDGRLTDPQIRQWVGEEFRRYNDRHIEAPDDKAEHTRRYETVTHLLVLSDLALLITLGDWSTDRTQEACSALGIKSFQALECVLAEKYGQPAKRMRHLHKGPGTGIQMYQLRKGRDDVVVLGEDDIAERADVWQEIGVGKELCFPLHNVLLKFVRADQRENPAVQNALRVVMAGLYRALHAKWHKPADAIADNVIDHWQQQVPVCDLNDIFPLLADGAGLLTGTHLSKEAAFKGSGEFEGDTTEPLTRAEDTWLLRYAGWTEAQITRNYNAQLGEMLDALSERTLRPNECTAFVRRFNAITGAQLPDDCPQAELDAALVDVLHHAATAPQPAALTPEERLLRAVFRQSDEIIRLNGVIGLCRTHRARVKANMPADALGQAVVHANEQLGLTLPVGTSAEHLAAAIDGNIRGLRAAKKAEHARIEREGIEAVVEEAAPEPQPNPAQSLACLREVFTDGFTDAVAAHAFYAQPDYRKQKAAGEYLDLNRKGPKMFLHNFIPSSFAEMEFPDESFDLITGVRSDSHEPNPVFAADLKKNIALMRPGCCILVDGLNRSYTREMRFKEVQDAVAGRVDIRVEVILDGETHDPKAVLLQRRHPTEKSGGYLTDDDKKQVFNVKAHAEQDPKGTVYFKPLDAVRTLRPDLKILNRIRAKLIDLSHGNVDIFSTIHHVIRGQLEGLMAVSATMKIAQKQGILTAELIEKIRSEMRRSLPPEGWQRFGALLKSDIRLPALDWSTPSMYALRQWLMVLFQAPYNEQTSRAFYDNAIMNVIRGELYPQCFPDEEEQPEFPSPDADSKAVNLYRTAMRKRHMQWQQLMVSVARNEAYVNPPYLTGPDEDEIAMYLGRSLFDRLRAHPAAPETMIVDKGLEQLDPGFVHTIPRRHLNYRHLPAINAHARLPVTGMPMNAQFDTPEARESLTRKTARVRTQLMRLRKQLGVPPVTLIQFDCITNAFLAEQMQDILGSEHFDKLVSCRLLRFSCHDDKRASIRHFEASERRRIGRCLDGGIVFVGGSWEDAYEPPGEVFMETVGAMLLPELRKPNSLVQYHGICFGEQIMAQMLGRAYGTEDVGVIPGCLEFTPGPMRIEEKDHPLFKDCGTSVTIGYTHGSHVVGLDFKNPHPHIRPLARSGLTGLPVAFEACGGNITGIQPHPEITIAGASKTHQERLFENVQTMDAGLRATFGIGADDLEKQWSQAAKGVRENAGPHLLVNALMFHVERLTKHLGQR